MYWLLFKRLIDSISSNSLIPNVFLPLRSVQLAQLRWRWQLGWQAVGCRVRIVNLFGIFTVRAVKLCSRPFDVRIAFYLICLPVFLRLCCFIVGRDVSVISISIICRRWSLARRRPSYRWVWSFRRAYSVVNLWFVDWADHYLAKLFGR